ncbi:hypothetical protein PHLCEN_2v4307, partial [Hermanssonia centrifuga]
MSKSAQLPVSSLADDGSSFNGSSDGSGAYSNHLQEPQWWPQQLHSTTMHHSLPLDVSLEPPPNHWLGSERQGWNHGFPTSTTTDDYAPPSSPLARFSAALHPIVPDDCSVDLYTVEEDLAGVDHPALPTIALANKRCVTGESHAAPEPLSQEDEEAIAVNSKKKRKKNWIMRSNQLDNNQQRILTEQVYPFLR